MAIRLIETRTNNSNVPLRLAMGHFATNHSHLNYYIDLTMTKHRLSEAKEVATQLCDHISPVTVIDTILCLDGTELIGGAIASELTRRGYANYNAHNTIYVVTPEHTTGSQLLFRENYAPMIVGKNVLVLAASIATGYTIKSAVEAIRTTAASLPVCAPSLLAWMSAKASRSTRSSPRRTICRIMRALPPTSARCARTSAAWMRWSTPSV